MLGFSSTARRQLGAGLRVASRVAGVNSTSAIRMDSTRLYSSTMHDNDPEVLEREKERNLTGQQFGTADPHKHAPGWNEVLASSSEAHIKADKDTGNTIELTTQTVDFVSKKYDPDNRNDATGTFSKDEVTGPLGKVAAAAANLVDKVTGNANVHANEEKGLVNEQPPNVEKELEEDERMTTSEMNVKADRGELL